MKYLVGLVGVLTLVLGVWVLLAGPSRKPVVSTEPVAPIELPEVPIAATEPSVHPVVAIEPPKTINETLAPVAAPDLSTPETVTCVEQLESGARQIEAVTAVSLEKLLQDLNRRKEYDLSQHQGNPTPDTAYFEGWIDTVLTELKRRDYTVDDDGVLHQPDGKVIAQR